MSNPYPIPRLLWESIDAVLYNKGVQLARDLARELEVDVGPLLTVLRTQEKGKFVILPDQDESAFQCQALLRVGSILTRCRCGTSGGRFCSKHERESVDIPQGAILARKIITPNKIFYEAEKIIYNDEGNRVGFLRQGDQIVLFEEEA